MWVDVLRVWKFRIADGALSTSRFLGDDRMGTVAKSNTARDNSTPEDGGERQLGELGNG